MPWLSGEGVSMNERLIFETDSPMKRLIINLLASSSPDF